MGGSTRSAARPARNRLLDEVRTRGTTYRSWDEATWAEIANTAGPARLHIAALGHLLGGHHRLHRTAGIVHVRKLGDLVFGPGATGPALREIEDTLSSWQSSPHLLQWQVGNAAVDALLSANSIRLDDLTDELLHQLVADYRTAGLHSRRCELMNISRVLADKGIIPVPLHNNENKDGPQAESLSTVPPEGAE